MEKIRPSNKIESSKSNIEGAGRGVFATTDIAKDELIESCPVVETPEKDFKKLHDTKLLDYFFRWTDEGGKKSAAICLGLGSLYNHSYEPNATYKKRQEDGLIDFIAIRPISAGEEITVNYNYGNPDDQSKLWIEDIPAPEA